MMKLLSRAFVGIACLALASSVFEGCNCEGESVGKLEPQIEVHPDRIDLGEIPVGTRATAALTVKNGGDGMLRLGNIALSGSDVFQCSPAAARLIAPSSSLELTVEARPSALGTFETTAMISSDDPQLPVVEVPIRIVAVDPPPCDDGNVCTLDKFNPESNSCEHEFTDGVACSPADKCIATATCSQGVCLGTPKSCDDHSDCTRDFCRQTTGECVFVEEAGACDDKNPCTVDTCSAGGCHHEAIASGSPCDDGDLCTTGDACFAGQCRGPSVDDGTLCDDKDSCTTNDTCRSGVCAGQSIISAASEGDVVFTYHLTPWPDAFLHRREVSLSDDGVFYGLDHLPLMNPAGLTHVVFAMKQCGSEAFQFSYRPPDTHVLVRFVRRAMQLTENNTLRVVVGVRQLPDDGYRPETTTYVLNRDGQVQQSGIQTLGGETGRALLPDGSHIFGQIFPISRGAPTTDRPSEQNLVVVREDRSGNVLWRHERSSWDWAEFLGVAGPRVLFWSSGRFGALDFNTGNTVWSSETAHITKEMALSTNLNLGVARATNQLIGVEILHGREIFQFPTTDNPGYIPRTDPVISADGRVLVLMQRNDETRGTPLGLDWVELAPNGTILSTTPLPYNFPETFAATRHEDDPYPTVADDGVTYLGYGDHFFAIEPGGTIRWTHTSTVPNAFTGTVPLLRDDGILLINEDHRTIKGIRTNGGRMSSTGWASFRHDGRRTNFTP